MPTYRTRPRSLVTLHRDTLLNAELSPTSRLLWALLVACAEDTDIAEILPLAGISAAQANPYLCELRGAGLIETGHHAEIGAVVTVHDIPAVPAQCSPGPAPMPCGHCGDRSGIDPAGMCRTCLMQEVDREAAADVARWRQQRAAGATYAIGRSGTRLHRWDCPTLNSAEKVLAHLEQAKKSVAYGASGWPRLPFLFTAEELRAKRRRTPSCAVCAPDPL